MSDSIHHGPMMKAGHDDEDNEYATPPELWRALEPPSGWNTDPCSGAESTPIAPIRFDKGDNGVVQPWPGDVFVNPPWSDESGQGSAKTRWLTKARSEANSDSTDSVVVLLPSDTSAGWFHEHAMAADLVCFYGPGRVSFEGAGRNPSFGLLIVVYGDETEKYRDVLNSRGVVIEGRTLYEPTQQSTLGGSR